MAPTGSHRSVSRQSDSDTNYISNLSQNQIETIVLGLNPENHHRDMLDNMSRLVKVETQKQNKVQNLTDMTIQCSKGHFIHTHRKLLSSVSSLARKLCRDHSGVAENQRIYLIMNVSTYIINTRYLLNLSKIELENLVK